MAQDPNDTQADANANANDQDNKGYSFSALLQMAKDKKNEFAEKMEKLDASTSDIPTLMEMALKELTKHEKKLNDLTDATEAKINFLSQFASAKGVIYVHSWKAGVGLIGGAYGRGILMAKGDGGWSLPLAVTKPEVKLGPQMATIEEDQILLLSSDKKVKSFVSGKVPRLEVGVDAFVAFGDKGQAVGTDDTNVSAKDQKGYGGGGTFDFGTYREFTQANEAFYGKDCDKSRILSVSPDMDSSDLVKSIGNDKLATTKKFIEVLEGFIIAAQDERAKAKQ